MDRRWNRRTMAKFWKASSGITRQLWSDARQCTSPFHPPFLNSISSFSSLIPSRQFDLGRSNPSLSFSTLIKQTTFTSTMDIDKPLDEIIDQKRSERRSARGRGRGRGAARGGGAVRGAGAPAGTGPVRNKHTGGAAAAGAAGPAASAPGKPVIPLMADGSKIIVSNLPTDVTENQIRVRTTLCLLNTCSTDRLLIIYLLTFTLNRTCSLRLSDQSPEFLSPTTRMASLLEALLSTSRGPPMHRMLSTHTTPDLSTAVSFFCLCGPVKASAHSDNRLVSALFRFSFECSDKPMKVEIIFDPSRLPPPPLNARIAPASAKSPTTPNSAR